MKNKKISIRTCILLCLSCIFSTLTVSGNTTMKEIVAYLNYTIDIVLDGEVQELVDAQGNRVYPISYNGTTYVPIRGVSTILGLGVEWDSVNGNVVLTTNPEVDKVDLLKDVTKSTDYSYILSEKTQRILVSDNSNTEYDNGLYCKVLKNQDFKAKDFVNIPIKKEVKKISFNAYSDTRCSINMFNQQGKLLKTFYLPGDKTMSFEYEIDSSSNTEIHFVVIGQSESVKDTNYAKILNLYGE